MKTPNPAGSNKNRQQCKHCRVNENKKREGGREILEASHEHKGKQQKRERENPKTYKVLDLVAEYELAYEDAKAASSKQLPPRIYFPFIRP